MSARLHDILEGYLDLRWQLDPVEATAAGRHELDGVFASYDRASVRELLAALKSYTGSLEEVDADSLEDEIDRTAALHAARHDILVLERERPFARDPSFHLRHVRRGIELLLEVNAAAPTTGAAALLDRVRAMPAFLERATEALTEPKAVFVEAARAMIPDVLALLRERLDGAAWSLSPAERTVLEEARASAVHAVLRFGDTLVLLAEHAVEDFAIGRDLFDRKLHTAHMIQENADELMRYGERLRAETVTELGRAAAALELGSSWQEIAAHAREQEVSGARGSSLAACDGAEPLARPIRWVLGTPATRAGWGLYCRAAACEPGRSTTPAERVAALRELLWGAQALMLDVALHTRNLDAAAAVAGLRREVGFDADRARAEVVDLCARPTEGLCPAVGRRDILRLRADAQRGRGAGFSLDEFHRELRSYGALPIALARWGMGLA